MRVYIYIYIYICIHIIYYYFHPYYHYRYDLLLLRVESSRRGLPRTEIPRGNSSGAPGSPGIFNPRAPRFSPKSEPQTPKSQQRDSDRISTSPSLHPISLSLATTQSCAPQHC